MLKTTVGWAEKRAQCKISPTSCSFKGVPQPLLHQGNSHLLCFPFIPCCYTTPLHPPLRPLWIASNPNIPLSFLCSRVRLSLYPFPAHPGMSNKPHLHKQAHPLSTITVFSQRILRSSFKIIVFSFYICTDFFFFTKKTHNSTTLSGLLHCRILGAPFTSQSVCMGPWGYVSLFLQRDTQ